MLPWRKRMLVPVRPFPGVVELRVGLVAGVVVSAPAAAWATGLLLLGSGVSTTPQLAPGVAGLWIAQALVLLALLPACVTLWNTREAAGTVFVFVIFPLPLLVLVWLIGSLPAATLLGGIVGLALEASLILALAMAARAFALRNVACAAVVFLQQVGLGTVIVVYRDSWMGWAGM